MQVQSEPHTPHRREDDDRGTRLPDHSGQDGDDHESDAPCGVDRVVLALPVADREGDRDEQQRGGQAERAPGHTHQTTSLSSGGHTAASVGVDADGDDRVDAHPVRREREPTTGEREPPHPVLLLPHDADGLLPPLGERPLPRPDRVHLVLPHRFDVPHLEPGGFEVAEGAADRGILMSGAM